MWIHAVFRFDAFGGIPQAGVDKQTVHVRMLAANLLDRVADITELCKITQHHREFFILDSLDQQKLYNGARNIEILVWRLSNKRDQNSHLFLLTNEAEGDISNLSFERIFGKMVALQDMMARIILDKTNRAINYVVHKLATASFIPLL